MAVALASHYKEQVAKRWGTGRKPRRDRRSGRFTDARTARLKAVNGCGLFAATGMCEEGHVWSRAIDCGREYCPTCGTPGSDTHRRRIARALPKAAQIGSMGYLVIEYPISDRERLRDPDVLREQGARIRKALKDLGILRGLTRWHWFGDPRCPRCRRKLSVHEGEGACNGRKGCGWHGPLAEAAGSRGRTPRWHPHLNVLFDAGFIPPERLEFIKASLRIATGCDKLIVHASYAADPAKKWHRLRYIYRSTFLSDAWDPEMADRLQGFRNSSWWGNGQWNGPVAWWPESDGEAQWSEVASLEAGVCPRCGSLLHWRGIASYRELEQAFQVEEEVGPYHRHSYVSLAEERARRRREVG